MKAQRISQWKNVTSWIGWNKCHQEDVHGPGGWAQRWCRSIWFPWLATDWNLGKTLKAFWRLIHETPARRADFVDKFDWGKWRTGQFLLRIVPWPETTIANCGGWFNCVCSFPMAKLVLRGGSTRTRKCWKPTWGKTPSSPYDWYRNLFEKKVVQCELL